MFCFFGGAGIVSKCWQCGSVETREEFCWEQTNSEASLQRERYEERGVITPRWDGNQWPGGDLKLAEEGMLEEAVINLSIFCLCERSFPAARPLRLSLLKQAPLASCCCHEDKCFESSGSLLQWIHWSFNGLRKSPSTCLCTCSVHMPPCKRTCCSILPESSLGTCLTFLR